MSNLNMDAIIMASGLSKRMGSNKLLLPIFGTPMITHTIKAIVESNLFSAVFLVTSHADIQTIGEDFQLTILTNENAALGKSESIKLGVNASKAGAYMFFTGDQPFLDAATIRALVNHFRPNTIVVPIHEGIKGSPTIFSSCYRDELLGLHGENGGKEIYARHKNQIVYVEIEDEKVLLDLDDRKTYEMFSNNKNSP